MSSVCTGLVCDGVYCDHSASPIEDLDFDSAGSLTSLDSLLSDASDSLSNAGDSPDAETLLSFAPKPESPIILKREIGGRKRPNIAPKPDGLSEDIVTTGAFLTRATLRKLGVVSNPPDPDTIGTGISVGDRVKILDLDKTWYTSIVLAIAPGKVLVHYPWWGHGYNEWVAINSRRLLYRGKQELGTDDSRQVLRILHNWDDHVDDIELDSFDLQAAIQLALGTCSDIEDTSKAGYVDSDVVATGSEKLDNKPNLPRGRPKGRRNRRRAGHIKRRASRPQQKPVGNDDKDSAKNRALVDTVQSDEPADADADADAKAAAVVIAPQVPKDMRISEIRVLSSSHNPYAKRPRLHVIFDSESEGRSDGDRRHGSDTAATTEADGDELPTKRVKAAETSNDDHSRGNAIWDLTRGPYVTTGAFFTRRTVRCLTHSESTGGIMKDHHGYYPGQLVDVLNANRTWYTGRVISYANKKFLINFNGWPHSQNEWIPAGSKRMRAATFTADVDGTSGPQSVEAEEDARRICAVLVDEYNAYVDGLEKKKAEKEKVKLQKRQQARKTPFNAHLSKLTGSAIATSAAKQNGDASTDNDAEDPEDIDSSVEPISVDSGYDAAPQLLRVKDYTQIYRKGMDVAARDRNKLWWKAKIAEIKSFRARVHYIGFPSAWDEWVEMNTQRIMLPKVQPQSSHGALLENESGCFHAVPVDAESGMDGDRDANSGHASANSLLHADDRVPKESKPTKRLGRPPGPDVKSAPLSLRLALKACMSDQANYEQCHPEEIGVFHLPREHMSTKDYSIFLKVGDKVRIRDRDKKWQDCTIIDYKHGNIRVCYARFSDEYNQWIPVNSDRIRVLRNTIQSDGRLEKLERESRIALRRKREKVRAMRRKRKQASMASLVHLAESLEYIVDRTDLLRPQDSHQCSVELVRDKKDKDKDKDNNNDNDNDGDSDLEDTPLLRRLIDADPEDMPLLHRLIDEDSDAADSVPLVTRLQLGGILDIYQRNAHYTGLNRTAIAVDDSPTWFVYCNQCSIVIQTFRYYCMDCEKPSDGYDYESFDLCLVCFSKGFPLDHPHPQMSFARSAVGDIEGIVDFTTQMLTKCQNQGQSSDPCSHLVDTVSGLIAVYKPDTFDTSYEQHVQDSSLWTTLAVGLHGTTTATNALTKAAVLGRAIRPSRRAQTISAIDDPSDDEETSDDDAMFHENGDAGGRRNVTRKASFPHSLVPRCAFCGDEDPDADGLLGGFVENRPLVLTTTRDSGKVRRQRFWAHVACAEYSPEVLVSEGGQWYNVAAALRRARTIKCAVCKKRGATVGCFHDRCQKSYHVACTGKPKSFFESGRMFWCPKHIATAMGLLNPNAGGGSSRCSRPNGEDGALAVVPRCANCKHELTEDLMWMVCLECPSELSQQFNICLACYESSDALETHPHKKRCFREHVSQSAIRISNSDAEEEQLGDHTSRGRSRARINRRVQSCHYCRSRQSRRWRKGYGGVVMCEGCFNTANSLNDGGHDSQSVVKRLYQQDDLYADDANGSDQLEVVALNPFGGANVQTQGALVEDYTQSIYFTRETCVASNRVGLPPVSQQPMGRLGSYGPTDSMLFTLRVDTTYFDIPGRAPRWGSHSGTDYHGTWLPQTVRRALLRYTQRGDRVLSNFLGRGTDAIECFLLSRKCVGVDINPSAVSLSQRNCSFTILPELDMSVEFRPVIMQGDARDLCSGSWPGASYFAEPESFDHILSHPPYKDCVLYSTNIDGDLSRFPGPEEFQKEMEKVIDHSWRLLKTGRHLTLGIGDNRAECFYIPVSYQLIRSYVCNGFELEELIIKRQRYCQAFGLGTYLCVQFDFLMFTHEFIATLRKVPKPQIDLMYLDDIEYAEDTGLGFHYVDSSVEEQARSGCTIGNGLCAGVVSRCLREVPPSPIARKSVVMGSVWTFGRHPVHSFPHLCMSRMVERFGRDGSNWEHVDVDLLQPRTSPLENADSNSAGLSLQKCRPGDDLKDKERNDTRCSGSANKDVAAKSVDDDSATDEVHCVSDSKFPDNGTRAGDYERARQRQIQENRQQLLSLGLVSELGEDSTDTAHYLKMMTMQPRLPASAVPLALVVAPHVPNTKFMRRHVESYRRSLVQITHDASHRLCPSGLLILGVQDVRDEHGKLWPLGMLVLEDVQRAVGNIRLRLKEFIVVVESGHSRKRDDVVSRESFVDEKCVVGSDDPSVHVPIVHAYYLVFMKLE
ncbi:hypothetical protein IW140_003187 [Coemansia sp. RSA 1813]|nr:hypothetical protein LPJ74_000043 [Coemansia sp. RSA 1843]KAJ2214437.1 hypothetical protein EV179_002980 [Coemansia sp. RSA 487]KAJ2569342.1 hypothetical protein IW140_003187 [Coemansia sp. RSA 1813]